MNHAECATKNRSAVTAARTKAVYCIKQLGKLICYNLVVLAVCIIPVELYFGSWFSPKLWGILCDVHWVHSGNAVYGFEKTIRYNRDSQCLRGTYNPFSVDVITVGGSATDQRYLTEGETWQDSISRYFKKNGRKLSIANAGVDGQSTIGNLWDFEHWFPKLSAQPKAYLFYIGGNDIYRKTASEYDDLVHQVRPGTGLKNFIKWRSALYHLYKTSTGIGEAWALREYHRRLNFGEMRYTEKGLLSDYSFYEQYLRQDLVPRLDALVRAARTLGSEPIFATQRSYTWQDINGRIYGVDNRFKPGGVEINGFDWYVLEKAQIEAILNFCKDRKVICIDAHQALGAKGDFYDFFHNTPQGAEKLGTYIGEQLLNVIK